MEHGVCHEAWCVVAPLPDRPAAQAGGEPAVNVLVTGASGFIGHNLVLALQAHGHAVKPVSRRHGVDMGHRLQPADWHPLLDGVEAVVNAAGIISQTRRQRFDVLHHRAPMALFHACAQRGLRRVVQVSALGADEGACTAFWRSKRAADQALAALNADAAVLRPSLVYGRGGTSAAWLMRLAALPWLPLPGAGQQLIQPVHISDVVATVLLALARPMGSALPPGPPWPQTLDVVGGRTLSLADWLQTLRAAQGRAPARLLPVPQRLALVLGGLLQPLLPLAGPDALRMLACTRPADVAPLQRVLGRAPLQPTARLLFDDASLLWRRA